MSSSEVRVVTLRRLLEDNFHMARHCRKFSEILADTSLKYYYQNIASRRSQFAIELAGEIAFFSGKEEPYTPSLAYDRSRKEMGNKNEFQVIKKSIRLAKKSLETYKEALCRIHEGSCREILLRHKAFIENSIFELKSIKKLVRFQKEEKGQLKEENSHTG